MIPMASSVVMTIPLTHDRSSETGALSRKPVNGASARMKRWLIPPARICAFAGCMLLAATVHANGKPLPFPELRDLAACNCQVSALVVNLGNNSRLVALHPGMRLIPASLSKLYVAAAVLRHYGAQYRFTTRLLADGTLHDGRLEGDLVFLPGGDPGLTNAELWQLANTAHAAGLREVTGGLVVNISRFGKLACELPDRCAALARSTDAYNAPLSAAAVNYGTVEVIVLPGAHVGATARVALAPFAVPMLQLDAQVSTSAANRTPQLEVERVTVNGEDRVIVRGTVPLDSGPQRIYRAVSDPDRYAGQLLRAFLQQAGIVVAGHITVSSDAARGAPLAMIQGRTLAELVHGMLLYSNNFIADMLALDLSADTGQMRPFTRAQAGALLARSGGAGHGMLGGDAPPQLLSGSGLSTGSRVSAEDLVNLLAQMYRDDGDFPAFLGALTVPAHTPVQMLQGGDDRWMTQIAVKTGSLDQPVSVLGVAGYLRFDNGQWGAFAVIANGSPNHPVFSDNAVLRAIRADLSRLFGS